MGGVEELVSGKREKMRICGFVEFFRKFLGGGVPIISNNIYRNIEAEISGKYFLKTENG